MWKDVCFVRASAGRFSLAALAVLLVVKAYCLGGGLWGEMTMKLCVVPFEDIFSVFEGGSCVLVGCNAKLITCFYHFIVVSCCL